MKKTCFLCDYQGEMQIKSSVENRNIFKCPNCSVQFMHPQTSEEELNQIYSNENYPTCSFDKGFENEIIKMKRKTFNNILNKVISYCKGGNILDIGCSSGILLEEAKLLGFNPYGIEISEYASSIAKKRIGEDKIYNGSLENAPFKKNYFNLITMIDIIEHVRNPIDALLKAREYLNITINSNGGGYIMMTVPNTNSFTHNIMGKKWTQYKFEHLFYFNKKNIEILANKTGFKIIYFKSALKTMTLKYMRDQFNVYKLFPITQLLNIINRIPIINKLKFKIRLGESLIILKKI